MNIQSVLVCGGTHGNELSGVYAVKHWMQDDSKLKQHAESFSLDFLLVNELAIEKRVRFIDEDFNRQFSLEKLAIYQKQSNETTLHEHALAQTLNQRFGPKQTPKIDFLIDIHNTTSNMGPTLIVLESDDFNRQLARYVKKEMPSAVILVEDHVDYLAHPYFCTLAKKSVMIEVGPQPQGTLRGEVYQQTLEMTEHVLKFIALFTESRKKESEQKELLSGLAQVEAFKLTGEMPYPVDDSGQRNAMIHPALDARDFRPLNKGKPCFLHLDESEVLWDGETVYPHFIGEAAYDRLNLAFATADKILF
uniref:aspartoacylase n=1 Tax=Ningiella ruwaisensis TaxID=2364274 RepID=UPI0010A0A152|nr:aspartoacylase [Ningiella ruwaisensis]